MADTLDTAIEARLTALIACLSPSSRATLARRVAGQLRKTQSARIAAQRNPDGSAYEPRKPQLRQQKKNLRGGMFKKLRQNAHLKATGNADGAVVAFSRDVERIARVHQLGLRDRVNRRTHLEVAYPARELLGITVIDEALLSTLISAHLADAL